jgi:uncharacterized membrane protein
VVSIVAAVQGVLVALISVQTVRLRSVKRDVAATREQVVNDHKTNMRDENDSRHAETKKWFAEVRRDLGGIRSELRGLRDDDRALEERVRSLEITDQGRTHQ